MNKTLTTMLMAAAATVAMSGGALAQEADKALDISFNVGAATDYVWRGVSQTEESPQISGGVDATVVHLDGAVESSVRLGVADLIADVVETGSTLKAAGLEVFGEPLMHSEAVLVTRDEFRDDPRLATLDRRLEGVLVARTYVLVDYNVREVDLAAATAITPGFDSPTISPLVDTEWVAVRAMVEAKGVNMVMDRLHDAGARGIIVTQLTASRL